MQRIVTVLQLRTLSQATVGTSTAAQVTWSGFARLQWLLFSLLTTKSCLTIEGWCSTLIGLHRCLVICILSTCTGVRNGIRTSFADTIRSSLDSSAKIYAVLLSNSLPTWSSFKRQSSCGGFSWCTYHDDGPQVQFIIFTFEITKEHNRHSSQFTLKYFCCFWVPTSIDMGHALVETITANKLNQRMMLQSVPASLAAWAAG